MNKESKPILYEEKNGMNGCAARKQAILDRFLK